jgi:hypothetical protein
MVNGNGPEVVWGAGLRGKGSESPRVMVGQGVTHKSKGIRWMHQKQREKIRGTRKEGKSGEEKGTRRGEAEEEGQSERRGDKKRDKEGRSPSRGSKNKGI